ncbi:Salt stress-induced protein [Dichanthelium oligosanthes]|uniref:Salt stress-induced protein n=1 Tax=Dichanthelium oligosanthes TaxID=888268 RepID=A0A1E5V380_9POAL|nr:Salt stress-induced protein [Dichanthelium oligosanthes]
MAMEKTIAVVLCLAALVVVTMSVPTPTADGLETKDMCSKNLATKVGLWGGNGGSAQDLKEAPKRLESITIRSNYSIDSIQFSYFDQTGQKRSSGRWGGPDGTDHKINLGSSEFVKEVSGTYNMFNGEVCLTSFKLLTNTRTWGPWAEENGTRFTITAPSGSSIVGFFARGGRYLDAIGVYLNKV